MRARRFGTLALLVLLLATPTLPARATGDGDTADSRVGVIMMVVCGLSLKVSAIAPVPWAGLAFVSCLAGLIDAGLSPDGP